MTIEQFFEEKIKYVREKRRKLEKHAEYKQENGLTFEDDELKEIFKDIGTYEEQEETIKWLAYEWREST